MKARGLKRKKLKMRHPRFFGKRTDGNGEPFFHRSACRASLLEGKVSDPELNRARIDIARKMIQQGHPKEKTERFLYFLRNIIHTDDPRENEKYIAEIGTLTGGTIDMKTIELARQHGIEDGIERERKKAKEEKRFATFKLRERGFKKEEISEILNIGLKDVELM